MLAISIKKPALFALVFGMGMMAGCGSSGQAYLRVLNASPDRGDVTILSGDSQIAGSLGYGSATGYVKVTSGSSRRFRVEPQGTSSAVIDTNFDLSKDHYYTVMVTGNSASLHAELLSDDRTAPGTGYANIRFVHASPSSGGFDLYLEAPSTSITNLSPTITNLTFLASGNNDSGNNKGVTDYTKKSADTYELYVTDTGVKRIVADSNSLVWVPHKLERW